MKHFVQNTRLSLIYSGNIIFYDVLAFKLSSNDFGGAINVLSDQLSASFVKSYFSECVSTAAFGGAICVHCASDILLSQTCFSHNFCNGCPDVIVWSGSNQGENIILKCTVNLTNFFLSSTTQISEACSNWFKALSLTLSLINTSSMGAKARSSGMCFGTSENSIFLETQFLLFDNCSTADYIIEFSSLSSWTSLDFDHFIITNSLVTLAVIYDNWVISDFTLRFVDSILKNIICDSQKWVNSNNLKITFERSQVINCPPANLLEDSYEWEYNWPNNLICQIIYDNCSHRATKYINIASIFFLLLSISQGKFF